MFRHPDDEEEEEQEEEEEEEEQEEEEEDNDDDDRVTIVSFGKVPLHLDLCLTSLPCKQLSPWIIHISNNKQSS